MDSFNDNRGTNIQMVFDFNEDLLEMEQPTEYAGIS